MLRISPADGSGNLATLKVEGRIGGPQTAELRSAVLAARAHGVRVVLDMSGVTFVDRDGVELLHALGAQDVELRACSTFISALVNGETR